jgi:vancomycin permeability regulator SanA
MTLLHWCLAGALLLLSGCHREQAYAEPFTAQSDLALLSEEGVLPRNINLKTFEPHRDAT